MRTIQKCILLVALLASAPVFAGPVEVKAAVEKFFKAPVVESIKKINYSNLYEVVLDNGELIYTDEKVGFLIDGSIIDAKSRTNITQQRQDQLARIDFNKLPLQNAIKQTRGTGKRVIASFEDPNCGYCKRLAQELATVDNLTVYTFLLPILGDNSVEKSRNIWCAKDKGAAWNAWMQENKQPPAAECNTDALQENLALAKKFRITGTPTIYLKDGSKLGGFRNATDLMAAIDNIK